MVLFKTSPPVNDKIVSKGIGKYAAGNGIPCGKKIPCDQVRKYVRPGAATVQHPTSPGIIACQNPDPGGNVAESG